MKTRPVTIERFNGRISIIGQGGTFKVLEGIEKKVVESIAKKDAAKERRAVDKLETKPVIPKTRRKTRVFRQFDYRKKG